MIFKRLLILVPLFAFLQNFLIAQSIAAARNQATGSTVTVRGIVTNGPELGNIRYLQDGSAGIAAFPGSGSAAGFAANVSLGDSVELTGTLISFQGLLEISPITAYTVISSNNPLPAPKKITLAQLSAEFESQLVQIECVSISHTGGVFNGSTSYSITDPGGGSSKIYLNSGHPLAGTGIPTEAFRLTAILSRYGNLQLLPRTANDLTLSSCLMLSQNLRQTEINTTGFRLDWQTNLPANCWLKIGTTPQPDLIYPVAGFGTNHSYVFSNLNPGTIYWAQVEALHNGQTIFSVPTPFATRALCSGQVKSFFTRGIDATFSNGHLPDGETHQALLAEIIARIEAAEQTLDVAMYNNNRLDLTNALRAAQARGVRVRYVASLGVGNTALNPTPDFPILYGNNAGIMHNKFMVIDAALPHKAWVMSGAMNWTSQNIVSDFNNVLFIQDQSLARAYEIEFEEMWGSSSAQPDPSGSRFGPAKRDNTPHQFVIDGHLVEAYFSPSDQTTFHIERTLRSAENEALFAVFSFTKDELGQTLVDLNTTGVPLRGIMENINDSGSEYLYLTSNGVNLRHHNLSGDLHHKYAVVDAYAFDSDPTVLTGSHNWSQAAESVNDENTLILHHPALAALFKAEFEKRWGEFPASSSTTQAAFAQGMPSFSVFPNPATDVLELRELPNEAGVVWVKDVFGRLVISTRQEAGRPLQLNVGSLIPGQYFVTFVGAHAHATVSFQKI